MLGSDCAARGFDLNGIRSIRSLVGFRFLPVQVCASSFCLSFFPCRARAACAPASAERGSARRLIGYLRRLFDGLDNSLVKRRWSDGEREGDGTTPPPPRRRRRLPFSSLLLRAASVAPSRRLPRAASSRLNKMPGAESGMEGVHTRARPEEIFVEE